MQEDLELQVEFYSPTPILVKKHQQFPEHFVK